MTRFTATHADGTKQKWSFAKDGKFWILKDCEGYIRTLEETWRDSVPLINLILENHGLKANIS